MSILKDKVVFITGASSGIGAASAKAFAKEGAKLLLCARREERLKTLADELQQTYNSSIYTFRLDVRDQDQVNKKLDSLPEEWKKIDVLLNNAGLSRGLDKLHEGKTSDWEEMIDTNVKGLLYVSRKVIPGMVERNKGHVINIGSIAGHEVYPGGNVYCATKHAVNALNKGMKIDLLGTNVRVTSIDPGLVETEFSIVRFHGDTQKAGKVYKGLTPLSPDDIADVIVFCAARPAHVNINDIVLMPTAQSSAALVHKE